jgi:hypothetical protein
VPAARKLIAEPGPFTRDNLKGRLPAKAVPSKHDGIQTLTAH